MRLTIASLGLLLCCCCAPSVSGQELSEKLISLNYFTFPKKPLPPDIKNYYVDVQGPLSTNPVLKSLVKSKISIADLARVDDVNQASMVLKLETGNLSISSEDIESQKDYQNFFTYYFTIKYTLPIKVSVLDKDRKVLYEELLYREEVSEKTESYSSPSNLRFIYISDAVFQKFCITKTIEKLKNYLNSNFGSVKDYYEIYLFSAKGKKLKYDELNDALKTVKAAFKNDIEKKMDAEQAAQLKRAEEIWKTELAKADTTNATAPINAEIYYGLNFNLAFSSLWLGNFDDASRYANVAKRCKCNTFYAVDYQYNVQKLEWLLHEYKNAYLNDKK